MATESSANFTQVFQSIVVLAGRRLKSQRTLGAIKKDKEPEKYSRELKL
jgi:hypothetical protein